MKNTWWQYRDWRFTLDMNSDGAINLLDVQRWGEWLFMLPGDAFIAKFGATPVGKYLQLAPTDFGSPKAVLLSGALWLLALFLAWYLPKFCVDVIDPTYRQQLRERREVEAQARRAHAEKLRRAKKGRRLAAFFR